AVQIIVYVGGIVVLIIFSIFLTQQAGTTLPCCGRRRMLFSGLATAAGAGFVLCQLLRFMPAGQAGSGMNDDMAAIGSQMLNTGASGYALPFEVISILLLAAMVGCIVIALKPTTEAP
ncbi:MAG TPA: NADH-quinone oxidoreductase subunit J, partial [Bacteroidia bacterium]|nr:NADH-quinone oxidoreductase subunit J [Bacteroidia bacterium]